MGCGEGGPESSLLLGDGCSGAGDDLAGEGTMGDVPMDCRSLPADGCSTAAGSSPAKMGERPTDARPTVPSALCCRAAASLSP